MQTDLQKSNERQAADFAKMVGRRIRIARKELNLSRAEVTSQAGFKFKKSLSDIESGKRRPTAEELLRLTAVLGKPVEFFTDPFLLVGEGEFSCRVHE